MKPIHPAVVFNAVVWVGIACAHAAPLPFGARTIDVPPPAGFVAVSATVPGLLEVGAANLPPHKRLVEVFVLPSDESALRSGGNATLERLFQIESLRAGDGVLMTEADFAKSMTSLESAFERTLAKPGDPTRADARADDATLAKAGAGGAVSVDGLEGVGIFRREPWGLFLTTRARTTSASGTEQVTRSSAIVLVNQQVMSLDAYTSADEASSNGRAWSEQAVSEWADAVRAANPDQAALAHGEVEFPFYYLLIAAGVLIAGIAAYFARKERLAIAAARRSSEH